MPIYKYKAVDQNKRNISGLVEAVNENSAVDVLKDRCFAVTSLEKKLVVGDLGRFLFLGRIKSKDIVILSRQFAVLISANIAIVQALRILVSQTSNDKLRVTMAEVVEEVDGGSKLSDSLAKRPKIFSHFFVNVVKSGETSGKLDEVLNYLADEMEKDYDMMSKIKGAMIYPAFVLSGLIVVGIVMMVSVVPKLTAILVETGGELPLSTRILISTSDFLTNSWWLLALLIAGLITGMQIIKKTRQGRRIIDTLKLKIPIFGRLFNRIYLVRFTRSLNTLIVGGVTISKGLEITAEVVNNAVFKELIMDTIKEVEDGNSISTVFAESEQVPKMLSQMMTIGEETGRLDMILTNIPNFYTREVNNIVANLMTLMEPIIMVIMGVAVGVMVAAIILPMYNMATSF